jgi:hypothetical protein
MSLLICGVSTLLLAACVDPLTKQLDSYGFAAIVPPNNGYNVGDVYLTADLQSPVVRLIDFETSDEIKKFTANIGSQAALANVSETQTYSVNANASVVGKATAELKANGATKFSVTFTGAYVLKMDAVEFNNDILPRINQMAHPPAIGGQYVIDGLLRIDSLEYTFYNDSGQQIDLSTNPGLVKQLQASLGFSSESTVTSTLKISAPTLIGYSLKHIGKTGLATGSVTTLSLVQSHNPHVTFENIDVRDLRASTR